MRLGFRFRRDAPQGDAAAVAQVLDDAIDRYGCEDGEFDLAVAFGDLLDSGATAALRALASEEVDERSFYERELAPNWHGLSQPERRAKVAAFGEVARSLGDEVDAGSIGPVIRTKAALLAWAYERTYREAPRAVSAG
jgi:hypothetical protein